jgi:hypothetical protein
MSKSILCSLTALFLLVGCTTSLSLLSKEERTRIPRGARQVLLHSAYSPDSLFTYLFESCADSGFSMDLIDRDNLTFRTLPHDFKGHKLRVNLFVRESEEGSVAILTSMFPNSWYIGGDWTELEWHEAKWARQGFLMTRESFAAMAHFALSFSDLRVEYR